MRIELKQVSYVYSGRHQKVVAVNAVSHTFQAGTMYAIIGSSGSGKSTLLSLLAGLKLPTSGEVLYDAMSTTKLDRSKMRRDSISVIYQDFNLFPLLTAEENVMYPLLLQKRRDIDKEREAQEKLLQVGLKEDQFKRLPNMLSGGEQQRVAIARALASGSEIILADEPTGNLDSGNSRNIVEILQKLAHEENRCVIIVTHDPEVAAAADVVLRMQDGVLV
ncbi:MAG: ABC transporter ATP-binding protein [Ruminococcaceae bacterium]|nr:ABC transporter ATP-binding protein [Oscillospiraceae bacterium]